MADILARAVDDKGHQIMDRRRLGGRRGTGGEGAKEQKERAAREQQERAAREYQHRQEAVREQQERAAREHQQRQEKAAREQQERAAREQQERAAREQRERDNFRRYMAEVEEKKVRDQQERTAREQKERDDAAKAASWSLWVAQEEAMRRHNQAVGTAFYSRYGDIGGGGSSQGGSSYSYGGSSYSYGSSSGGYGGGYSSSSDHRCMDGSRDMRFSDNWGFDKYS
jgi:hypothetical protein